MGWCAYLRVPGSGRDDLRQQPDTAVSPLPVVAFAPEAGQYRRQVAPKVPGEPVESPGVLLPGPFAPLLPPLVQFPRLALVGGADLAALLDERPDRGRQVLQFGE